MTYEQTIDYLFHRLPMFSRIGPAALKKDITNTVRLCDKLSNPQNTFRSIHVGGTNGKGSTCHMIAAILQTSGYKTGLYTSPHLRDFRERIKINGEMIPKEQVVHFVEQMEDSITEIEPSFFELTVAMAFDYFRKEQVDIAVIEVGLGGRLDSTNVISPEFSIITNIGWDHMNILGNSIEEIALEKAGIIKKNTPVITGWNKYAAATKVLSQVAGAQDVPLIKAEEEFIPLEHRDLEDFLELNVLEKLSGTETIYQIDLHGHYQKYNLSVVLAACRLFRQNNWKIEDEHIMHALRNIKRITGFAGRYEIIHHQPAIILDVAHNEDGFREVVSQFSNLAVGGANLHIVLGMVRDKDISNVLSFLPANAKYYFTMASIPRALPVNLLVEEAGRKGLRGEKFDSVNIAIDAALKMANEKDFILVCGSVFLVGEVDIVKYTTQSV